VHSVDELLTLAVSGDDDARWTAIQALHALGTREVYDRAVQLCRGATPAERIAGADIIGQLSSFADPARATLTSMVDDEEPAVIEAVVHALGQQQNPGALEPLARLAAHSASNVRWAVATALEDLIADERAEKVMLGLMRDEDLSVRDRATFAIGSLSEHDSPRIRAALFERLRDEERSVAHEAALGLARRRDARAIPYIAVAVDQADEEIEEAADEITVPEMLNELLKARDAASGVAKLIERCRARQ
jgi:HEAT repeat protein